MRTRIGLKEDCCSNQAYYDMIIIPKNTIAIQSEKIETIERLTIKGQLKRAVPMVSSVTGATKSVSFLLHF